MTISPLDDRSLVAVQGRCIIVTVDYLIVIEDYCMVTSFRGIQFSHFSRLTGKP